MTTPEPGNPFTWTEEYVRLHRTECLSHLRKTNQFVMFELLEGDSYDSAAIGISGLCRGLGFLHLDGYFGDLAEYAVEYSLAEGALLVFGDSFRFKELTDDSRREEALTAFKFARDLGQDHPGCKEMAAISVPVISALKAGTPLAQIRREHADLFPNAVHSVVLTLHNCKLFDNTDTVERAIEENLNRQENDQYERNSAQTSEYNPGSSGSAGGQLFWIIAVVVVFILCIRSCSNSGRSASSTSDNTVQNEISADETPDSAEGGQEYEDDGFVFPNSGTELIERREAENLSDRDLTYAINEIYARHGYIFQSDEMRGYYEQFSWYAGRIPSAEFSVDLFNQIEQQNWNLLINERNRRKASG